MNYTKFSCCCFIFFKQNFSECKRKKIKSEVPIHSHMRPQSIFSCVDRTNVLVLRTNINWITWPFCNKIPRNRDARTQPILKRHILAAHSHAMDLQTLLMDFNPRWALKIPPLAVLNNQFIWLMKLHSVRQTANSWCIVVYLCLPFCSHCASMKLFVSKCRNRFG